MNQEETTIDLMDLLRRCLEKWKFILLWMLIGAVLVNCAGAAKSVLERKNAQTQLQQEKKDDETALLSALKEAKDKLTDREADDVETAFSLYKEYQAAYEKELAYYQNSIRMKLDPAGVSTVRLSYLIDNHYEAVYPVMEHKDTTSDIISILMYSVLNETTNQKITDALQIDNVVYAQELVSSYSNDNNVLCFNIVAEKQEDCELIAEIIKQAVNEQVESVRAVCGDFDIIQSGEQYTKKMDLSLQAEQENKVSSLRDLKSTISNLTYGMSEDQQTYYNTLLDEQNLKEDSTEQKKTETTENIEAEIPVVTYVNMKWLLSGTFVGILCACAWITLKYMLTKQLRTAGDMEEMYGLTVLGCITDKDKKKMQIFRNGYDVLDTESQLNMIATKIQLVAEKEKYNRIFVGGTMLSEKTTEICEKLLEKMNNVCLIGCSGGSLVYDENTMREMAESDAVVFVEQIDASQYAEIKKAKELCEKCHQLMIGCVVVE
ncbi:MAG: hypothetical protein V8Q86_09855 [Blautia sp.]